MTNDEAHAALSDGERNTDVPGTVLLTIIEARVTQPLQHFWGKNDLDSVWDNSTVSYMRAKQFTERSIEPVKAAPSSTYYGLPRDALSLVISLDCLISARSHVGEWIGFL